MLENAKECTICHRLISTKFEGDICPACQEEMLFSKVKEYIRSNPGVGIQDVAENCDVEPSQIQQWLREERLELTEGSAIYLQCEKGGAPIRSGRFCEKCKYEMSMDLQSVLPQKQQMLKQHPASSRDGDRMRYL